MSGMIFVNFPFLIVRTLWNSLPDIVVKAESVKLQGKTGQILGWSGVDVNFNWKADIKGTRSRSNL